MGDVILVFFILLPIIYLIPDLKLLYIKFSKPSKLHGWVGLLLAILLLIISRYFLIYLEKNVFTTSAYATDSFRISLIMADSFLWLLVSQLEKNEIGLQIIRLGILYGTEILLLYPIALIVDLFIQLLIPSFI